MSHNFKKNVPTAHDYSSFVVIFGYAEINANNTPIMALCGKRSRRSYYIPLDNAHQFADSISGEPTDYLMMAAVTIASVLGLGADKFIIKEICDAIVDSLPDLLQMPPAPQMTQKELIAKAEQQGLIIKSGERTLLDAS